jgi:hypothetical protein
MYSFTVLLDVTASLRNQHPSRTPHKETGRKIPNDILTIAMPAPGAAENSGDQGSISSTSEVETPPSCSRLLVFQVAIGVFRR